MLESLRLIDFKSFVDETIPFAPVTVLVGANAAGKSNVLDALRFLRRKPDDPWQSMRGRPRELARYGTSGFAIHGRYELLEHPHGVNVTVVQRLRYETTPALRLLEEAYIDETGGLIEPCPSETTRSTASQDADALAGGGSTVPLPDPFEELMAAFSMEQAFMRFVDIRPERMLAHDPDGCWHDDFVDWQPLLKSRFRSDPCFRDLFIEWAAELCAPGFRDVELVESDGPGGVDVVLVERDGRRISARSMSEGDLRCLGILTVLLGGGKPGPVCFEAPTTGVHPSRARLLVELFYRAAPGGQIIVTTHDASLLSWLDDEQLGQAVLLARTPEHPGTVARRLGDLPGFFDAKRSLGLDEMLATQWLEMAI